MNTIRIPVQINSLEQVSGVFIPRSMQAHMDITAEQAAQIVALAGGEPTPVNDLLTMAANPPNGYAPLNATENVVAAVATPVDGEDASISIRRILDNVITKGTEHTAILAAIKAGKVPGVCDPRHVSGLYDKAQAEIAALRARVADAERRADEMEGKAGEWIARDVHITRVQNAVSAVSMVAKEREKECHQLKARVAELEVANNNRLSWVQANGTELVTLREDNARLRGLLDRAGCILENRLSHEPDVRSLLLQITDTLAAERKADK